MKRMILSIVLICVFVFTAYAHDHDGVEFNNSTIIIPASSEWDFGYKDFTIETSIKFDTLDTPDAQVVYQMWGGVDSYIELSAYTIDPYPDLLRHYFVCPDGTPYGTKVWNGTLPGFLQEDVWYDVASVRRGNEFFLYVNSTLTYYGYVNMDPGPMLVTEHAHDLELGSQTRYAPQRPQYFYGWMDEVRIWDKALTPEELTYWSNNTLLGSNEDLLGYWDLDNHDGNIVYDLTGNGNNGTMIGTFNEIINTYDDDNLGVGNYDSGKRKYIITIKPDHNGYIYRHYLDEDWGGQGCGRPDKDIKSTAGADGSIGYEYFYHENSNVVRIKYCYGTADYSTDPSNPILSNLIDTFEYDEKGKIIRKTLPDGTVFIHYLNDANRLKSKMLSQSDADGYSLYEYLDEDYNGKGYGRIGKKHKADGSYEEQEYWDNTERVKTCKHHDKDGAETASEEYYFRGTLKQRTFGDGVTETYYMSGRKESLTLTQPDESGSTYYHYLNENRGAQGFGRVDKQILASPDVDGASSYQYEYASQGMSLDSYTKLLLHLDDAAFTDNSGNNHAVTSYGTPVICTDGGVGGSSVSLDEPSYLSVANSSDWSFGSGDFTIDFWAYLNEYGTDSDYSVFFSTHSGHVGEYYCTLGYQDELSFVCTGGTALNYQTDSSEWLNKWTHVAYVRDSGVLYLYLDGVMSAFVECDDNLTGNSKPLLIGGFSMDNWMDGNIDEFRVSNGIARWTSDFTPSSVPYGNTVIEAEAIQINKKVSYKNSDFTESVTVAEYDLNGKLKKKTHANGDCETYYSSGKKESVLLGQPDESGNTYYHYRNEDWNGQGQGRIDKRITATPDSNGARAYIYSYMPSRYTIRRGRFGFRVISTTPLQQVCTITAYANANFTQRVGVARLDASGNVVTNVTSTVKASPVYMARTVAVAKACNVVMSDSEVLARVTVQSQVSQSNTGNFTVSSQLATRPESMNKIQL